MPVWRTPDPALTFQQVRWILAFRTGTRPVSLQRIMQLHDRALSKLRRELAEFVQNGGADTRTPAQARKRSRRIKV